MKNAFRAGLSLVGIVAALLTPAVAAGQIDAGQTVGDAVGQVGDTLSQAPVQVPAAPVQPASPPAAAPAPPATPSVPAGPPPAPASAGGSSGPSGSGATPGGASGSTRSDRTGKPAGGGGGGKARAADGEARAAGNKSGGAGVVLAQTDTGELDPPQGESYSGAVTTSPDTGLAGDPELPFTGGPALLLLAMGIVALAAGLALRTAGRRRHAG